MTTSETAVQSFEATYPQYPFAELVRLSLAFAGALRRALDRIEATRLSLPHGPVHPVGSAGIN